MPKKPDETYLNYKGRVIDVISPTFCAAKWLNATIWLGSGATTSCHHPPAHKADLAEIATNPSALHNTQHKKQMRKLMQEGSRPSECDYCWKIEDMNREAVSDRTFKTVIYDDADIKTIAALPWDADVDLKTLEIAFDRTCNFACSYCNASFSTTWARDIKQNGPYENLVSDGAAAFQQDGGWAQPYRYSSDNPYVQAFWKWWPRLSQTLDELRITGGEPLMSGDVWKLLDYVEEHGLGKMRLALNSNLGAKDELINDFIVKSKKIGGLDIYTSCEAFGSQAEYIRDGMVWDKWVRNCERMMEEADLRGFHVMMTINSLCLFSITECFDMMLSWKEKYGKEKAPTWSVNILRFPSFQSPLALPNELKDHLRENLRNWFMRAQLHPLMSEMEKDGIARLIDYLEVVNDPHRNTSSMESRHRDFRSFYEQYDRRRGKNIRETFPELVEWLDGVPVTDLGVKQELVDGDSTKGINAELQDTADKEGWVLNPEHENPK
jgi:organic radical activating enzyme